MNWFYGFLLILICAAPAQAQQGCNPELWNHVYDQQWLRLQKTCKSVTGTVYTVAPSADGNMHIRVMLDKGQEQLINEKNKTDQFGCLLVVPVCVCAVSYPDVGEACTGYVNNVSIPKRGAHVKVTGSYVFNFLHGWYEIHPVTSIVEIP